MQGLNGGLIGVQNAPSQSKASGLWFPNEQSIARRANIWPRTDGYRYYRLSNFASTSLNSDTIDFGEIELYNDSTKHTGITCTTNWAFTYGTASNIVDGYTDATTRAYHTGWSAVRPTAIITFDLGSTKVVTHIKIYSLYAQPRFPASFDLSGSLDNSNYVLLATITVGASFSLVSGVTYASNKVAV